MNQLVGTQEMASNTASQKKDTVRQFLTFYLKDELFCLPIEQIKEIIGVNKLTSVPMVPDFIKGIINLRGIVVPVIDLSIRFGWEASKINKRSCTVILEIKHEEETLEFGISIDSVNEVIELTESDIGPAPSFGSKIRTDFISNMIKIQDEFVVVLDVEKVLSFDELSIMKEVTNQNRKGND